jgi:Cu+-exporting ATPase
MEKVNWKVGGMTCSNCALSIKKFLEKQGVEAISVNPLDGSVSFQNPIEENKDTLKSGLADLGYPVLEQIKGNTQKVHFFHSNKNRFLFTLPFSTLLMLHMFDGHLFHLLHNPMVQLLLCLPVFLMGMRYFGKSAWNGIKSGIPNMNLLVTLGALVAFLYSLIGMIYFENANYLFFETTASIITLVFLGNYLEESTMQSTRKALQSIAKTQKVIANMIAFDSEHNEQIFPVENELLKTGDLVLIKTGELIPADCKILWGEAMVDEAIISGESLPIFKSKKDFLIGGSMLHSGLVKAQVTATGEQTVISSILQMAQHAQAEKPPLQKLADRISAVFVPIVIAIACLTFLINYFLLDQNMTSALMRSIAVLVISCPCAMGLATPAAISVGLGRAARKGIVFRNATALESFKKIKQIVFDKTGTLTTGKFEINSFHSSMEESAFKTLVYSLEKYSSHPIAKSVVEKWPTKTTIPWKKIEEVKGMGVRAEDKEGNLFELGSAKIREDIVVDNAADVYLFKNGLIVGWIEISDEIRPEAKKVIDWLYSKNISSIMLTGDVKRKALDVAEKLGIKTVFYGQSPSAKLEKITELKAVCPTAMVGDGINDAPALAKSSLGISLSDASEMAVQHADVILMNKGIQQLPEALGLGQHTYFTIKQNLFWAFAYNIVAIPVAFGGWLTPTFSAMAMGFSDVMLALISMRLYFKKVV